MTGLVLALYLATAACVGFAPGEEPKPPKVKIITTRDGLVPCPWHEAKRCHGKYTVRGRHRIVTATYETVDAVLAHEFIHHLLRFWVGTYDGEHSRPEWACQSLRLGDRHETD